MTVFLNTTETLPTCFLFFKMEAVSLAPSFGPLAQLVEQLAFNQLVPRSSRGRPTKNAASRGGPLFFPHRMKVPPIE